ncbi:hypothetical protein AZF37_00960 [endosymbiont 'TC1' of Trimyema compressum]|uniref:DUF2156 domain-containing protein n=1 Tax=endosymbiont 'TC1' of Trimyema compressum TaxID=243899 RepID=UPI0007F0E906|nr:DUF2156 domain-containing protein [endosymbiont 'TC1' of Trimyema compressum]AMP19938.1 hypothetical protein AZF37_00960 [endosymbiont 'TC1' of Trimyema compressum]
MINWISIFYIVSLINTTLFIRHSQEINNNRLRELVVKHGQNPISYLTLESDKKIFYSKNLDAAVAYKVVRGIFVCCGDIICSDDDSEIFLNEIQNFCKQNGWSVLFLNITGHYLNLYKANNFRIAKYGEDACFNLSEFSLKGGKIATVRSSYNRSQREGIIVKEYKHAFGRDYELEKKIKEISEEWLENKNTLELSFMLGSVCLNNLLDRRIFMVFTLIIIWWVLLFYYHFLISQHIYLKLLVIKKWT